MATDKQIQANRANAKKSTGPRTQAGRAQSAKNGQSHSWLARTVVIPGESADRFTALLTEFEEEYAPQTAVEQALVENIVTARWNLMRLMALQNAALIEEILRQQSAARNDANTPPNPQSPSAVAAVAFRSLADQSHATDLLCRHQDRYDKQFDRADLRLSQIRTNFEKEGAKPIKPSESIT